MIWKLQFLANFKQANHGSKVEEDKSDDEVMLTETKAGYSKVDTEQMMIMDDENESESVKKLNKTTMKWLDQICKVEKGQEQYVSVLFDLLLYNYTPLV